MKTQKYLKLSIKLKTRHQKIQISFYNLSVKILNGNKSVTVNALFDSGSDSTLLPQNAASYLSFNDKGQSITFSMQLVKSRNSSQNYSTFLCRQSFIL